MDQKKKGFWRRLIRFLTGKELRPKGNCQNKAKTAEELRDHWRNQCPWWGP